MNYLSHFYLHRDSSDEFFTIGLTLPDILSFFRRTLRFSEKLLRSLEFHSFTPGIQSLITGMVIHYQIDRWFHRSVFFKDSTALLQSFFKEMTGQPLDSFHAHVLCEILVDRYLLLQDPGLADDFYRLYRSFDFRKTFPLFQPFSGFDSARFLEVTRGFAYAGFLGEYGDFSNIRLFLDRLSRRVSIEGLADFNDQVYVDFFTRCYRELEPQFPALFREAANLGLSKSSLWKSLAVKEA